MRLKPLISPGTADETRQAPTSDHRTAQHVLCAAAALAALVVVAFQYSRTVPLSAAGVTVAHAEQNASPSAAEGPGAAIIGGINPNTATAAELTVLPGIGKSKAGAIVAFREEHTDADDPASPVFRKPEDLQAVRGIGPATVERLRPWLRFDDGPVDGGR